MITIPWKNYTPKHPDGVCEAATSIWLSRICKNGIDEADKLTALQCDDLQEQVESGEYTWAADLLTLLGGEQKAGFNAFEGPNINSREDMKKALDSMKNNDFFIISATNGWGDGHSVAGYKKDEIYYFFDPNTAIYIAEAKQIDALAIQICENLAPWHDKALRKGYMK